MLVKYMKDVKLQPEYGQNKHKDYIIYRFLEIYFK